MSELNRARAARARQALRAHNGRRSLPECLDEDITDLMVDLLHLCVLNNIAPKTMLTRCKNHIDCETH